MKVDSKQIISCNDKHCEGYLDHSFYLYCGHSTSQCKDNLIYSISKIEYDWTCVMKEK